MGASNHNTSHNNYLNVNDAANATGSFKNMESNRITFRNNETNMFEINNENLLGPRDDGASDNA